MVMHRSLLGLCLVCIAVASVEAQAYPVVKAFQRTFSVGDVSKANVSLDIHSTDGIPRYRLQCHAPGYPNDPDFDYSGDFECRLSFVDEGKNTYSTLLTENSHQSRDWESRGRFFAASLRSPCAAIPDFGDTRTFELRAMRLTLHIDSPTFTEELGLRSLVLTVGVRPSPTARREIAERVPLPTSKAADECAVAYFFPDPYRTDPPA